MTNELGFVRLPTSELATNAIALADRARRSLAKISRPEDGAKFVHDAKAIRDRIHKLRLDKEAAFEAAFPWDMAWLEGMRHTGTLIAAGQKAGTIADRDNQHTAGNKLLLADLEIEKIESSRWQRFGSIHDQDWQLFEKSLYEERREPTFSRVMALWHLLNPNEHAAQLPDGKFGVVYADPPWEFGNAFVDETRGGQTAEDHYPTMPSSAIREIPVRTIATSETLLFLWVPNALLMDEGRTVMEAWGFDYKTCMVWVKPKRLSMGWWVQNRHEMLLIGAGADATPPLDRPDSVIEAAAPEREHSRKPDEFYTIIESMHRGPYLEMFARNKREGWESWGNELE
jgi:N6-adenosine-specific RNA methylase IME4